MEVRLEGTPVGSWTWLAGLGLLELPAEPVRGDVVELDFTTEPACAP